MNATPVEPEQLFRQQVVDAQGERLWGDLILSRSIPLRVFTVGLSVLVVGVSVFLALNTYSRKETVTGNLVPDLGLFHIQTPQSGIVQALNVGQGDLVNAGQLLFSVQRDRLQGQNQLLSEVLYQENLVQEALLEEQIEQESERLSLEQNRHQQSVESLEGRIGQQQESLDIAKVLEGLQAESALRARTLHKEGYLSDADLDSVRAESLKQSAQVNTIEGELQELHYATQQANQENALLVLEHRNRVTELQQNLSGLQSQQARQEAEGIVHILAPVTGVVTSLDLYPGQIINPQQMVMTLVPEGALLQAQLFLPSSAVGFIKPGQEVNVRYRAFPYQKFGTYHGEVLRLADSPEGRSGENASTPTNQAFFQVTVALPQQGVNAFGELVPLKAGMELSADIVIEERSLLEWLFEPLFTMQRS